jgi:C4-dicarboxylate-specific signal transduction histidine kinase
MSLHAITASIAHELRQPLTAISANSQAAQLFLNHTKPKLQKALPALDSIVAESDRASQILNDLAALFTSTDKGQMPIDVNEVSLQVLGFFQEQLNAHGVRTQIELATDLPLIMGHKSQLQEVMINLLQNSIEAMNAIEDGRKSLQLRTERRDGAIVVEVKDSGPGISPENLDSIFDTFFTTKSHGTGLGLAICRMIIERHGGQLSASSDGTSGALFQFVLPSHGAVAHKTQTH